LLDLSRIQRRGLQLERRPFDVNVAVLDAVQAVRQSALEHKLELRVELAEGLPFTSLDPQRMQQVLSNLLNNAIKFTPAGGRITVRSRLIDARGILIAEEEQEGAATRWIVLDVEDNGEGIPQDFLPYVWDRFRQADASSRRRHGGLGIGLALVKELVEAHAGTVEARSEGHGATFTIRLPVITHADETRRPPADKNEFMI
jgi:hypothetical protein